MRYHAAAAAAALTGTALFQSCPAPFGNLAVMIARTALSGTLGAIGANSKRGIRIDARQGPCAQAPDGVPQYILDDCCSDLDGREIFVEGPLEGNGVRITGLPNTCIAASPYFEGAPGPVPYACGTDCLEYETLSAEEYNHLKDIYDSH